MTVFIHIISVMIINNDERLFSLHPSGNSNFENQAAFGVRADKFE